MSKRFHTFVQVDVNTAVITDLRTQGKLHIHFTGTDDPTGLIEFIDQLRESLWNTGELALELFGESHIYFDWMIVLNGFVSLRNCELHNTDLENVKLSNVNVKLWKNAIIKYSEMENQVLQHEGGDLMVHFCCPDVIRHYSLLSNDTLIKFNVVHAR